MWYYILVKRKGEEKMSKYRVCFIKYYTYVVDADNEDEAIDLAFEEDFYPEMHSCIADCTYDEVECDRL